VKEENERHSCGREYRYPANREGYTEKRLRGNAGLIQKGTGSGLNSMMTRGGRVVRVVTEWEETRWRILIMKVGIRIFHPIPLGK
jgi:hypothetical protein